MTRRRTASLRFHLLLGASAPALMLVTPTAASAQSLMKPVRSPGDVAVKAATQQATRNASSMAATQRTLDAFRRAADARKRIEGAQAAARAAAMAAQSSVPNGLTTGGLQVAAGAAPGTSLWSGAAAPVQSTGSDGRTKVGIDQSAAQAILTWDSFNVGRETDLTFNQHGNTSWSVLNRVTDASADPSRILGSIKADGSVYIINRNGIVFGGSSQVNVRSLTASSLDIHGGQIEQNRPLDPEGAPVSDALWQQAKIAARDARFVAGLIGGGITYSDNLSTEGFIADAVLPPEQVLVEAGAQISAASLGQVILVGHRVQNSGTLVAPDGQVLLAAGGDIWLESGSGRKDSEFLVGITSVDPIRGLVASSNRDGRVGNDGLIVADRGNVTLHGFRLAQDGVIAASTGAEAPGSIILDATTYRYGFGADVVTASAYGWGDVTIGIGSHMSILPDGGDKTVTGDAFRTSSFEVYGNRILVGGGSEIYAPSAELYLLSNNPATYVNPEPGRLYIGEGARIDVSGLGNVTLSASANEIRAELRANEVRDNPILRGSLLRSETVYFDGRLGGNLTSENGFADLSGWYNLLQRGVNEFMTAAGTVKLSGPEIITRAGSVIDLSGGAVHYTGGTIRRTQLIDPSGRLIPIEQAAKGVAYLGLAGDIIERHGRWGVTSRHSSPLLRGDNQVYQAAYDQGRSAGSLTVLFGNGGDQARIFDGTVTANVVEGPYQQGKPDGSGVTDMTTNWQARPARAVLNFSNADPAGNLGGDMTIADGGPRLGEDFTPDMALFAPGEVFNTLIPLVDGIEAKDHVLPASWFDGETFGTANLVGNTLTIGEDVVVDLGDHGSFSLRGRRADIDGTIRAAGGTVRIEAVQKLIDPAAIEAGLRSGVSLGDTAVIDVAGRWTNNYKSLREDGTVSRAVIDGGSVSIFGYDVDLAEGSVIDVSGGAHLQANGGAPLLGDAGSIVISNAEGYYPGDGSIATQGTITIGADLLGYAPGKGGSLEISTGNLVLVGGEAVLQDGILAAGEAAPFALAFSEPVTLPAGATLPFDVAYISKDVLPGVPFGEDANAYLGGASTVTTAAEWIVPDSISTVIGGNNYYYPGMIVPAGTTIYDMYGSFAVGTSLPRDVFPTGITFYYPASLRQAAGPLSAPFTLPEGLQVPTGTVFDIAVPVNAPQHVDTAFFNQGGFSSFAVSGGRGVIIREGVTIAPSVDQLVLGDVAGLATGASLSRLSAIEGSGITRINSSTLPEGNRPAMSLSLGTIPQTVIDPSGQSSRTSQDAQPGDLSMAAGSAILMNGGSTVTLQSYNRTLIDGTIDAAGGTINLGTNGNYGTDDVPTVLRLGDTARISARGYERAQVVDNQVVRSVVDGGTIQLGVPLNAAEDNYGGLAREVSIAAGAVLDVSGVSGVADLQPGTSRPGALLSGAGLVPVAVDGNGGAIQIVASNGVFAGEMRLGAGGAQGAGGSLTVGTKGIYDARMPLFVRQSLPEGLETVAGDDPAVTTAPTLIVDRIRDAGTITLISGGGQFEGIEGILFDGSVDLVASRAITLRTGRIQRVIDPDGAAGTVRLAAPYVNLSGPAVSYQGAPIDPGGFAEDRNGSFTVDAGLIDISGRLAFDCTDFNCYTANREGGFENLLFRSTGDIRLRPGSAITQGASASFASGGTITFDAAQLYVANRDGFYQSGEQADRPESDPGFLVTAGEKIVVRSNGASAPTPFSYGERLTLSAPDVEQAGVIRAPGGQIILDATETLTLAPGSVTSVSLDGLVVPFGYLDGQGLFPGLARSDYGIARAVTLRGPAVDVRDGATVDVSGGGDLLGFNFISGNTGSRDVLRIAAESGTGFAVLPGFGGAPAPIGQSVGLRGSERPVAVGDAVWLNGGAGLPAGYYTLLPAHYALLDGGVLVRPLGGSFATPVETFTRPDGSVYTAGFTAVNDTSIRGRWSAYELLDRDTFGQYSNYTTTSYNAAKVAQAASAGFGIRTFADAGAVQIAATETINLAGTIDFSATDGRLGVLDITAPHLVIGDGSAPEGSVGIDAGQLAASGAGSILIGGFRPSTGYIASNPQTGVVPAADGTTRISVGASSVTVADGTTLTVPELMLVATDDVIVGTGAVITAAGEAAGDTNTLRFSGDGAFLRLSSEDRVGIDHTDVTGATGRLTLAGGAVLRTDGALTFDASAGFELSAAAVLDVAQLDLSADRINLGDVPAGQAGTTLGLETVQRLAQSSDLLLRGRSSITLFGDLDLGGLGGDGLPTLGAVTLDTALLRGVGGTGASITAGTLTLANSGSATGVAETGSGDLALDVGTLRFGPGATSIAGFAGVTGSVGEIVTLDDAALAIGGDVRLATGRVVAGAGSTGRMSATGTLALTRGTAPAAAPGNSLGGAVTLAGRAVTLGTDVIATGGTVTIDATASDLTINDGSRIDVAGTALPFGGTTQYVAGGSVRLSAAGTVTTAAGTAIDVSGPASGAGAGIVDVTAGGTANLAGALTATTGTGVRGGEISVVADGTNFAELNAILNAGNFTASRAIWLEDAITLAAGETITAHRVDLRSADGAVRIAGTINAAGDAVHAGGGVVSLTGTAVELAGTARIAAQAGAATAADTHPASGSVTLSGDRVDFAAGAGIDVSGGRHGGGRVTIRADRTAGGVNAALDGTVTGARQRTLVGMVDYATDTLDAGLATSAIDAATAWLAGAGGPQGWSLGAGMAFTSTGDLTLATDLDLAGALGAGYVGLTAAGDVRLDASISDGFASAAPEAALLAGTSSTIAIAAGGDVVLAADERVRTGTGDIGVAAGRDLVLTNTRSVIYSAGAATATEAGFDRTGFGPVKTDSQLALGEFPTLGGDLSLAAGRDILAPVSEQSASAWLYRYGQVFYTGDPRETQVLEQTSWSVLFRNFESGVGAFGGGDVRVRAGRDVRDLGVALPTTGHQTTLVGRRTDPADLVVRGGGSLDLRAGRDLLGGQFILGRGHAKLVAGRDVGQGAVSQVLVGNPLGSPQFETRGYNPVFGLMDATVEISAGDDLSVEGAYDLTQGAQVCENFVGGCGIQTTWTAENAWGFAPGSPVDPNYAWACSSNPTWCVTSGSNGRGTVFSGYTDRSAIVMTALGGAADYLNNGYAGTSISYNSTNPAYRIRPTPPPNSPGVSSVINLSMVSPGTLRLAALSGGIRIAPPASSGGLVLAPASRGTLSLIAADDIFLGYDGQRQLQLQDIAPEYIRSALAPRSTETARYYNLGTDTGAIVNNNGDRGFTPIHLGDPEPVRIIARDGSIRHFSPFGEYGWYLNSPKPVDISAGLDIVFPYLTIQHNDPSETSRVVAGRDNRISGTTIYGPGLLWVEAGRDMDRSLGFSVVSSGNGTNLALADVGADIVMLAGSAQGTDYDAFNALYLNPDNLADPAFPLSHPNNAGKVPYTYQAELDQYLADQGITGVTPETRMALFGALPAERQKTFLQSVLASEFQQTGIDYNTSDGPRFRQYTRGYRALELLYPGTADLDTPFNPEGGNIRLNNGMVESRSGGDIQMFAPYGQIVVGIPAEFGQPGGIITRRGGNIDMIANGSIGLDLSRVFTLQGGDILMWTSYGDITAGAGAKTSVTNVPLSYLIDRYGNVSLNVFGLQTGAGIGVLDALEGRDDDRPPSRLDLLAFFGEVNAGDAGIRVVGDLNIAALRVVNAANIQVTGDSMGIPLATVVNTGALTAASAATGAVVKDAIALNERTRPVPVRDIPTVLNVRFVGFGSE